MVVPTSVSMTFSQEKETGTATSFQIKAYGCINKIINKNDHPRTVSMLGGD